MAVSRFSKPSPGLIAEFKAVVTQLPQAEPRKMFGYDAAFVNGNMAVGLWQNTCVVKLSPADQAELLGRGLAQPFAPMPGRVMNGWLELSEELAHDPEELLSWSQRAVAFAASLPPKAKKPRTEKASVKKAPAKKAPARKAPIKKAPIKKAPAKKAPIKKAPVKKRAR